MIWLLNKVKNIDGGIEAICPDNNTLDILVVVRFVI